jgi:hypothetical protein
MKIIDIISCKSQAGDVGIEIELEANNIPQSSSVEPIWRREVDASLRGESGEFVLNKPIALNKLDEAFAILTTAFQANGLKARPTYRAGIHVHVNVQQLTPLQLVNFMCLYFLLEEVLVRFCDKTRHGNHFCLRMTDASSSLDSIVDFIIQENIHLLKTEDLRYASLNITSLFKYGSVEFRALESTLDFERIKIWASVLTHLRDYATTIRNPVDLLGEASVLGFEEFVPIILGKYYPHFKKFATEANIRQGVRNIQYAVHARDWSQVNHNIFQDKGLFGA